jgi:hypothetical protein
MIENSPSIITVLKGEVCNDEGEENESLQCFTEIVPMVKKSPIDTCYNQIPLP